MNKLKITVGDFIVVDQTTQMDRCDFDTTDEGLQWTQHIQKEMCLDGCSKMFGRGGREATLQVKIQRTHNSPKDAFEHKINWPWTAPSEPAPVVIALSPGFSKRFESGMISNITITQQGSMTEDVVTLLLTEACH